MTSYAVLDVETTGLHASQGDRILELAVVRLDADFVELDRLDTLVSVPGPVGATEIHGIHASDLVGAPSFENVAGHLATLVRGAVLVAHYPRFDMAFLDAELRRIGSGLPPCHVLDTRDVCRAAGKEGRLRLVDCCAWLDVRNSHAHAAMSDVRATTEVLRRCAARGVDPASLARPWPASSNADWPTLAVSAPLKQRAVAA